MNQSLAYYPFRFPLLEVERLLPVIVIVLVIRVRSEADVAPLPLCLGWL